MVAALSPPPSLRSRASSRLRLFFVSSSSSRSYKPLHVAAWGQHVAIVRRLAAAGALLDARNGAGETALYVAAEYNCADAVGALLDAGASPAVADHRGWTPEAAARAQGHAALADRLGAAAADFARDKPGGFRKPAPGRARGAPAR